jgi:hypothetical protein
MKKINILILILALFMSVNTFGNEAVFRPVQNLFSAMSAIDHVKMRKVVTEDFQLLEAGEDWDIADLINVVKFSEYKRRNFFGVINTKVSGDMAWVSYWNKATFNNGKNGSVVAWLESAVMIKVGNEWKIQMLHSTRIKPESIPKSILLTEFIH